MAEKNKSGFHTVGDTDMEEYNRKIKEHRRKVLHRTVIVTAVILLVLTGLGLYMALRHYENYDIMSTAERSDTAATHFTEFQGNILKYSNDGAFYLDAANELIWNQTYEMSSPKLDTCGNYLSIYDKGGTKIYILTPTKLVGSIETTMQIQQVCVAEQGTVAVLMKKDKAAYLALYDREGNSLAEGDIHGQNGGYPIAIALSNDAVKLAVSMININEGSVKSTIAFYNYGTVGQNEIDHCVGVNNYDDMVIPEMEFTSNDRMVAFGDTKAVIFEGAQKPQAIAEIAMDENTKSIFYNERYILPLSHDEVVHGKATIAQKMNGGYDGKFPQARAFYMYMYAHPGAKLNFMGNELAQLKEWCEKDELDWILLKFPVHEAFHKFMADLNQCYLKNSAFSQRDFSQDGFSWVDCHQEQKCMYLFERISGDQKILAVFNFSDEIQEYTLEKDYAGYELLLASDMVKYGGKKRYTKKEKVITGGKAVFKMGPFSARYYLVK